MPQKPADDVGASGRGAGDECPLEPMPLALAVRLPSEILSLSKVTQLYLLLCLQKGLFAELSLLSINIVTGDCLQSAKYCLLLLKRKGKKNTFFIFFLLSLESMGSPCPTSCLGSARIGRKQ